MNPLAILRTLAGLLLAAALFVGGYSVGKSRSADEIADLQAAITRIQFDAQRDAFALSEGLRLSEQAEAERFAEIATMHQKELTNVQANADRLVADVRAKHVRLRQQWRCPVPGAQETPAASGEPDGRAELQAASVGRIDRAVGACDAQVRGLQALLMEERLP